MAAQEELMDAPRRKKGRKDLDGKRPLYMRKKSEIAISIRGWSSR
jgi:hypothetical protein